MDRELLLKRLQEARRHAKEGAQRIGRQKRIVATLKLAGRDARMAINLVETMQALQATAERRCIRLERQLAEMDAGEAARTTEKRNFRIVS
jgi:hypothetical protein